MSDTARSAPEPAAGLLPLALGVTGHRDLRSQDLEALKHEVTSIFESIRQTYPHTPLILLSSLAQGADRLVARAALDFGAQLISVLPMPRDEYARDFPDSVAEFDALLDHEFTERSIVVPPARCESVSEDDLRSIQYLLAGIYVARHSQILIALWDGSAPARLGGTAQIVRFKQTGDLGLSREISSCLGAMPEPYWPRRSPLDPPETGPIYHVLTPRASAPEPDTPKGWKRLAPDDYKSPAKQREYFERIGEIYGHIDTLNADILNTVPHRKAKLERNRDWLFPDVKSHTLSPALQILRNTYACADTVALHFQTRTHGMLAAMFLLVFFAVVLFGAYAHLVKSPQYLWFLAAYVALLVLADVLYVNAKRLDYQNKYQDYRALAEGLRVQFFWRLAGLENSASDHYLRKQKNELDWIRNAIQTCGLVAGAEQHRAIEDIRKHWVEDQYKYFNKASERDFTKLVGLREAGSGSLLVSLGLALFEMFSHPAHFIMPAIGLAAVGIGLWHFYVKTGDVVKRVKEDAGSEGEQAPAEDATRKKGEKRDPGKLLKKLIIALPCLISLIAAIHESTRDHSSEAFDFLGMMPGLVVLILAALYFGSRFVERAKDDMWRGLIRTSVNYLYGMNLALLMTLLLLKIPGLLPESLKHYFKEEHHDWIVVAMGLGAVTAALMHGYAEKRALAEHHKQYKRMKLVFFRATRRLDDLGKTPSDADARELILDLGKEALVEHGDWVLLHRERPIELPKAEI